MISLSKSSHASHFVRCITGLPASQVDFDNSRLAVAYYCLSGLDILNAIEGNKKISLQDLTDWKEWIWKHFVVRNGPRSIGGFRSGTQGLSSCGSEDSFDCYDQPHLIMTYTALLALSILRDDFSTLDRPAISNFLKSTQHLDGSFSPFALGTVPSESDLRMTFCAFAISFMLNDWSAIDVDQATRFILSCRTYEGGFGESPGKEAQGGPTYCALASLKMVKSYYDSIGDKKTCLSHPCQLSSKELRETARWLIQKQKGGFQGRTEKHADACYCFWCGASLRILDKGFYVDNNANATFLFSCQYRHGGIAKEPGKPPDPYHTYLALAALSLYPPSAEYLSESPDQGNTWKLNELDPLLNLRLESARWARQHIPNPQ